MNATSPSLLVRISVGPRSPLIRGGFGALTTILIVLCLETATAQYVEVNASIETISWHGNGVSTTPWDVRCVVGANTWQMDGSFLRSATSTAWFTGTHIILNQELSRPVGTDQSLLDVREGVDRFLQVATPSGQRWTKYSESVDGNPGRALRTMDLLTLQGRIAWLAFCSGPCLKREGRRLYPPSDLWKEIVSAPEGFADRTVAFDDSLGLPRSVRLETTDNLPILQYGVVSSTNLFGWEFPLEFYIAQYRPATSADFLQTGWEIDFIAKGTVTAVGPGSKPVIPPAVLAPINQ